MQVKTEVNIPYQHFQCTCKIAVYFQVNYNKEWVKSHGLMQIRQVLSHMRINPDWRYNLITKD